MRGYSINNYLNFNLNYKLTIDLILVDYNDKPINKTNQHKLNKNNETWYNKYFYCIVNIYMRLTQLEWIKSDL